MIARHETRQPDLWAKIAAPLPAEAIQWRQDGRPIQRDGKFFARFVAYVDAQFVRERLDSVVPGEWDLSLALLPTLAATDENSEPQCSFKARLQILGVIREDVGSGRDYKTAASDAFKRAAVRFGVAHELYSYEHNWVQVDGDSKYAKPVENPADAYERKLARKTNGVPQQQSSANGAATTPAAASPRQPAPAQAAAPVSAPAPVVPTPAAPEPATGPLASDEPSCPKCGGRVWDNRLSKRNPKAPDFKCRNRSCDGVIWPPKPGDSQPQPAQATAGFDPFAPEDDDLPF